MGRRGIPGMGGKNGSGKRGSHQLECPKAELGPSSLAERVQAGAMRLRTATVDSKYFFLCFRLLSGTG